MLEHRNVVNFFTAMDEQLAFAPGSPTPAPGSRHQHLVRHLGARAVLDAHPWLHRRRAGRRVPPVHRLGRIRPPLAHKGDGVQPLLLCQRRWRPQARPLPPPPGRRQVRGRPRLRRSVDPRASLPRVRRSVSQPGADERCRRGDHGARRDPRAASCCPCTTRLASPRTGRSSTTCQRAVGLSFASAGTPTTSLAPENFERRRGDGRRHRHRAGPVAASRCRCAAATVADRPDHVPSASAARPRIWITAGGSPATFEMAGRMGANILTNLLVMAHDDLVANLASYRAAYREAGHPGDGHVTLMLHTFVGRDLDEVMRLVREPFLGTCGLRPTSSTRSSGRPRASPSPVAPRRTVPRFPTSTSSIPTKWP